jgi:signal peptidase I
MTSLVVDVPSPRQPTVRVLGVPAPRQSPEIALFETAPSAVPVGGPPVRGPRHARPSRVPRTTPVRRSRRWVDHLLTLAALLGLAMTAVTMVAVTTGLRPLVVRSGSMEPTIHTGSMVLVRTVPARDIRVGDIVAVERPDRTRVTHRVVSVEHRGATASLVLKGDANTDPDPEPVVVTQGGRLVFTAPALGRVGAFLSSAKGGFALGWLVACVTLTVLRRKSE